MKINKSIPKTKGLYSSTKSQNQISLDKKMIDLHVE